MLVAAIVRENVPAARVATAFQIFVNRTTLANLGLTMPPEVATKVTNWVD